MAGKLTLGSFHYELTASIPAVFKYLSPNSSPESLTETYKLIANHEAELASVLLKYLNSKSNIVIYGESTPDPSLRVPTVSFVVEGWKSSEVVKEVETLSNGLYGFRHGTFYSVRLSEDVLGLGKDGVVRVSMVHYNTCKSYLIRSYSGHQHFCMSHSFYSTRKRVIRFMLTIPEVDEIESFVKVLDAVISKK